MSAPDSQNLSNRFRFLAEATAWLFRSQGVFIRWKVRDKLLSDPFYRSLLGTGRLPTEGVAIDLGCGRGVLLAFWSRAMALGMIGGSKRGTKMRLIGIDADPEAVKSASLALTDEAEIFTGDLRTFSLPECHVAILQNVLLFLETDEQEALLSRIASCLEVGGCIILHEPDAANVAYRAMARLPGNVFGLFFGNRHQSLHPRSGEDWKILLQSLGLQVETMPVNQGQWLPNISLLARKTHLS